jgi:hypothetical protein
MYWQSMWFRVPPPIRWRAGLFNGSKGPPMATLKVNNHAAAALKAGRERDRIQATRDYEAGMLARQANMMRLRALRLASDNVNAPATTVPRLAKKRTAIRSRGQLRKSS